MVRRETVIFLAASLALVPVGCGHGDRTEKKAAAAPRAEVTLHVPGMTERLGLT